MYTNNSMPPMPPRMGFCAHSGTGKTTLLKRVIPILRNKGLKLTIIKHAHHNFDTDQPGKDSYELRKAGAQNMLVSSSRRWALIHEHSEESQEATLSELMRIIAPRNPDIVLIEGFKHESFSKIELHRRGLGHPYIYPQDKHVVALATDERPSASLSIPLLDINVPESIADFIVTYCRLSPSRTPPRA